MGANAQKVSQQDVVEAISNAAITISNASTVAQTGIQQFYINCTGGSRCEVDNVVMDQVFGKIGQALNSVSNIDSKMTNEVTQQLEAQLKQEGDFLGALGKFSYQDASQSAIARAVSNFDYKSMAQCTAYQTGVQKIDWNVSAGSSLRVLRTKLIQRFGDVISNCIAKSTVLNEQSNEASSSITAQLSSKYNFLSLGGIVLVLIFAAILFFMFFAKGFRAFTNPKFLAVIVVCVTVIVLVIILIVHKNRSATS